MDRGIAMKAFITGISGFVGGYLAHTLLDEGIEVWGSKLPHEKVCSSIAANAQVRDLDLRDTDEVKAVIHEAAPDLVFHLAAQSSVGVSWQNPALTIDVNITGGANLLEAVRTLSNRARVLLVGSSEEYGKVKKEDIPIKEDHRLDPQNPYAVSKVAQEMLGKLYANAYDMDIVMVRAFNHTGPGQTPTFVIPDFSRRIALIEAGKMEPVLKVGNLDAIRDFSHVEDIVRGYILLAKNGHRGEVYNIGSGVGHSIQKVLDRLLSMTDADIEIARDGARMRPSDNPVLICDNTRIRRDVGWEPQANLDDILGDVLNYWRQVAKKEEA